MTEEELIQIEALVCAARPGPWKSYIEGRDHQAGSNFIMIGEGRARQKDLELIGATHADQDFIASARQDVPALLNEIKRLKRQLGNSKNA